MGYLFGTPLLYGGAVIPVALSTAGAFLLLGVGLVAGAGPEALPLQLLVGPSTRAKLLRVFLPLTVGAILLQSLLHKYVTALFRNQALGAAMFALGFALITGGLVAVVGRALGRALERAEAALIQAHNELEQKVQERTAALITANNSLQKEIGERQRAEKEILELNQRLKERLREIMEKKVQLEAANKELESFSYAVSHDLRAPLRIIDGFSQALREDCSDKLDSQGQDYLMRILRNTQRMEELIDSLLVLSRLTRREMRREKVDLGEIAQKLTDNLRESDPQRQVEMVIAPGLEGEGDPSMLRVVLENLLDNAWKFTGKKAEARIEVGALPKKDGPRVFYVRDNGAGFDMAFKDKLFGAFQRLHGKDEFPGNGVGLATVQRIIHRHGGRVWAEGAVDQGAVVYFTLSPIG
ncbi:MAG: hypothetical protein HY790_08425 [Deltaproteobacteria bacterium]|nr:hypothetical protein [Deltaproteobacteria bacterium]